MARESFPKSDIFSEAPRNAATMLESVLGTPQAYVRAYMDNAGCEYFALTSVQGEILATFAQKADAHNAMAECKLLAVTVH